jgi:predicted nucleic acid-binding protein
MKKNRLVISLITIGLFSVTTSAQAKTKHGAGYACVAHYDGYGKLLRTVCADFTSTKVTKNYSLHADDAYISAYTKRKVNKTSVTLKDYH